MRLARIPALSIAALAAVAALASPAMANPHRHKVCHVVHDHGHAHQVCSWR